MQKNQSGFAHIAIIAIILSVTTLGTLGYVFYQNTIGHSNVDKNIPKPTTNTTVTNTPTTNTEINNNSSEETIPTESVTPKPLFSFTYPDSSFYILKNDTFNGVAKKGCVSLETADYKSGPMGPEAGASISVCEYKLNDYPNIKALIDYYQSKNMISDLSQITVDGQIAYRYLFSYEYGYSNVLFEKNGKNYQVMLSGSAEKYGEVYYMVYNSLKVN